MIEAMDSPDEARRIDRKGGLTRLLVYSLYST
jgi:hypothetical protein